VNLLHIFPVTGDIYGHEEVLTDQGFRGVHEKTRRFLSKERK